MLIHHPDGPADPSRVVLLGASGFVGHALAIRLSDAGIPVLAPTRGVLDLAEDAAGDRLGNLLRPDDCLVLAAALTPDKGRDIASFMANLRMGAAVAAALARQPVAHLVYLGSDAVYPLTSAAPVTEATPTAADDLYAAMHLSRELMLRMTGLPMAVLRPTLIYGAADTHNSYGPNRLRRAARADGRITLFGEGEELRDHIEVDDVASLILAALRHRSTGILNLATGVSISYRALAEQVAALFDRPVAIQGTTRRNPILHRHFDAAALHAAFPDFAFTPLPAGLARAHAAMLAKTP